MLHVTEAQHSKLAVVHMHRCVGDDRTQQEVAKLAKCGLENKGKQQVYAIWEAGLVSPRPACLYWKGWAVRFFQKVGGLGGHAICLEFKQLCV